MTVSLVDYGLGNLGSVVNMLKRIGTQIHLVRTPDGIHESDRLLLPGVGAFDAGMRLLDEQGLGRAIQEFAASQRPLLGICLGMQLLLDSSDEGDLSGLGLVPGRSIRFEQRAGLRIPHMGWNLVRPVRQDPLVANLPDESRFYFVHSYRVVPDDDQGVLAITEHGDVFASMIRQGNVMGAQFHPEKSHAFGMQLLKNFASL